MVSAQPPSPPSDGELEERLARVDDALAAGNWKLALTEAEEAASAHPESAEAHHACGLALHGLGRFEAALLAFYEAVRLAPEVPDPYLDAAELLIDEIGDDLRALEVLRDARRWLQDPRLHPVRDPDSLARLPPDEATDWTKLWSRVGEALRGASGG